MMKFVHSILIFYGVSPSQLSVMVWHTVLEFEALCDLYALEYYHYEVFSVMYLLRKTTLGARYPQSGVEKIIVNMVDSDSGMPDTMVRVSAPWDADLEMSVRLFQLSRTWTHVLTGGPCLSPMSRRS